MSQFDMNQLMIQAYEVADLILASKETEDYLRLRAAYQQDAEAQRMIREFQKVKDLFHETERFGHFHPNYHEAKDKVHAFEQRMDEYRVIADFKEAEQRLDNLLYEVSKTIAHQVSDSIKVPSNNPLPEATGKKGCGCG
jgi:cell fate (sporulation/competence/biofilm development) regulator YlbF (YheA/YmcA/DUF963 family)